MDSIEKTRETCKQRLRVNVQKLLLFCFELCCIAVFSGVFVVKLKN